MICPDTDRPCRVNGCGNGQCYRRNYHEKPNDSQQGYAIERMTDEELAEEQRVLNAEIEAATERLSSVENELFYRKHPECRMHEAQRFAYMRGTQNDKLKYL